MNGYLRNPTIDTLCIVCWRYWLTEVRGGTTRTCYLVSLMISDGFKRPHKLSRYVLTSWSTCTQQLVFLFRFIFESWQPYGPVYYATLLEVISLDWFQINTGTIEKIIPPFFAGISFKKEKLSQNFLFMTLSIHWVLQTYRNQGSIASLCSIICICIFSAVRQSSCNEAFFKLLLNIVVNRCCSDSQLNTANVIWHTGYVTSKKYSTLNSHYYLLHS